jgi:lipopolysaccharide biosynthesis regulator YciM
MVIVLLLAACARRLDQLAAACRSGSSPAASKRVAIEPSTSHPTGTPLPRAAGFAAAAITVACSLWSMPQLQQHTHGESYWFDYLRLALPQKGMAAASSDDAEVTDAERTAEFKQRLTALNATVKHDPSHARAQLRLASSYLAAFDHLQQQSDDPMSLSQLRDAAQAAQFDSIDSMRDWLDRAVGKNVRYLDAAARHAKKAVQLCPLQGQAYVHLAELRFLEDLAPQHGAALLQQALLVRPQSATVQFAVGRQRWLDGKVEEALESWKFAFHQDKNSREQILTLLVGNVPAPVLLNSLQPDLTALQQLETRYLNDQQPLAEYPVVARAYAAALKKELANPECDQPVERLIAAAAVYNRLKDQEATEACLHRALEIDRSSFVAHKMYGVYLYEHEEYAEATQHLNWCVRMAPQDRWLRGLAEDALDKSSRIQPASFESRGRKF